jgi:CRP-like cAMP-binding protein
VLAPDGKGHVDRALVAGQRGDHRAAGAGGLFQLFNSSKKRLARVLLLLAHFGKEGQSDAIIPKISQPMLAEMIGTTRSRVRFLMNRFRKLGFLEYTGGVYGPSASLISSSMISASSCG